MTKSPGNKDNPDAYSYEVTQKPTPEIPNLDGDRLNFFLLLILYVIQGFPIGLSTVLPVIIQSKPMMTYADQAAFSIALWPFAVKLLWAPVVDALYVKWMGRRKSWLVPLQLIMGSFLLYMANNIDDWLPEREKPNLKMIVFVVLVLNFLSATQDIVVDGWSLTMLKKKNVRYASMSNYIGILCGIFIGSVSFTLLVSEQFSSKYFRTTPGTGGLTTMKSFLFTWAVIVFSVTSLVVFKRERDTLGPDYEKISILRNYGLLWDILKLPRIRILAIALLTTRFGYSATESVSHLKFIDAGVSKDDIMIMRSTLLTVQFAIPIFISKYITGPKPMSYYLKMTPIRLLWGYVFVALYWFTPSLILNKGVVVVPLYYYLTLGFVFLVNEMLNLIMMLAIGAFFCQMSDPRFGGTYMTLFNTFYFTGWLIPNTFILKLVYNLTFSKCTNDIQNDCSTEDLIKLCKTNGGTCKIYVDGYFIAMAICTTFGFVWYGVFRKIIKNYQSLSLSHWMVNVKRPNTEEVKESCLKSPASAAAIVLRALAVQETSWDPLPTECTTATGLRN